MMDKDRYDTRVWHRPYHSLPTPPRTPNPDHTSLMNHSDPDWTTAGTVQITFTTGNTVGIVAESGSRVENGGHGGGGGH